MGKIDKFLAKPVEVTIGGEQFMIKPFTVADMDMITKMGSDNDSVKSEAIKESIFKLMKQIDDSATEEIVGQISMEYMEEIMNAISTANNLDVSDAKAKLIEDLKSGSK